MCYENKKYSKIINIILNFKIITSYSSDDFKIQNKYNNINK